jgi:ABC-type dipeptide/oligopeptide/nickel transport system permease component
MFAVTAIVFLLMRVTARSPQAAIASHSAVEHEAIEQKIGGLDFLFLQYLQWITDLATGDLGMTPSRRENIADLIRRRGLLSVEMYSQSSAHQDSRETSAPFSASLDIIQSRLSGDALP